jgi:pyruvate/2-oxoglutarate dehydrogenase complex dihydrolipoamide acyltransferase (E2) component
LDTEHIKMADKVVMPQLGESIAEGTIVKWLKQPGDAVKKDEDLLVISTDKVEAEIPSPSTGVLLSIDVPEGETVDVGTVLGYVGEAGEASPGGGSAPAPKKEAPKAEAPKAAPAPTPAPAAAAPAPAAAPASTAAGRFVSPLVRRIAQDNGISDAELDGIPGTGNNGRVTKKDLLTYVDDKKAGRVSAPAAAAPAAAAPAASAPPPFAPASVAFAPGARESVQAATGMRKVIMANMVASKATSAHVTTFF